MTELIHFAHGNGFPSLCYKSMLDQLRPRFDCCYIEQVGHNPQFPLTENWHGLVSEVLDSVIKQARQPVIAVGHSLGGILTLLAAIERPELFKAVVLLDSPILGRFKSSMVHLAKSLGLIDQVTPAKNTKGRRVFWQTREQLLDYLRTRDLFKTFSDESLNDYINYGLEQNQDGYFLKFNRQIEYQIYRTVPHDLPKYRGRLQTPTALIYGDKSTVVDRMDRKYMKKYFHIACHPIKGTHLFPMEDPQGAAKRIIEVVDAII